MAAGNVAFTFGKLVVKFLVGGFNVECFWAES